VSVAAEAIAAAQFARIGWDVSVQYGANQPGYDLVVVDGIKIMKVSVKGSQDGSWGLTQSLMRNADYQKAADDWFRKNESIITFLIQFKETKLDELPRMYLATALEVSAQLKKSAAGRGDSILYEYHHWGPRAKAAGTIDSVPEHWRFSSERVDSVWTAISHQTR
jgi:hypothetical protein